MLGIKAKIVSRSASSASNADLVIREVLEYSSSGSPKLGKVLGVIEIKGEWQYVAENALEDNCKAIQQVSGREGGKGGLSNETPTRACMDGRFD